MVSNNKIIFRVNPAQKERIRLLAEASGLNISEYVRKKALNGGSENMIEEIYREIILKNKNGNK